MPRPFKVASLFSRVGRPGRIAVAAAGAALVGLPVIGAVASRMRGGEGEVAAALGSGVLGLDGLILDPAAIADAERSSQATVAARNPGVAAGSSGTDLGAGPGSWSLEGVPDLLGLGGKVVTAGVDGAGEVAKLAGHGIRGLVDVAGAVGGALPDLGDVADVAGAVGEVAGAVLGAIGDGLGDLNV